MPIYTAPVSTKDTNKAHDAVRALASIQQKVGFILSGIRHKVVLAERGPSIGWTDGKDVFFDTDKATKALLTSKGHVLGERDGYRKALASLSAVAKHELCHLLYSPAKDHPLIQVVGGWRNYHLAWNALEDQRIESLFVQRYPIAKGYFTLMIGDWVLAKAAADKSALDRAYPLIAGRWYLPAELRRDAYRLYADACGVAKADRVREITTEYRSLDIQSITDPAEIERVFKLIVEFASLWSGEVTTTPTDGNETGPEPGESNVNVGESDAARSEDDGLGDDDNGGQQSDNDSADGDDGDGESGEGQPGENGDGTDGDGNEGGGGESTGKGSDGGAGDGDGVTDENGFGDDAGSAEGQGDSQGNDSGTGNTADDGDPQGSGKGASNGPLKPQTKGKLRRDIAKAAADIIDDVLNGDGDVTHDIDGVLDTVDDIVRSEQSGFNRIPHIERHGYVGRQATVAPTTLARTQRARVADELRSIRNDLSPAWERNLRRGSRIDFKAITKAKASNKPPVNVFRKNTLHGDEGTKLDVVLAIDISGSMASVLDDTLQAAWSIKSALADVDVPCTIVAYDTGTYLISGSTEREWKPLSFHPTGGTNPTESIVRSIEHFDATGAQQPVLIVLTDGEWGGAFNYEYRLDADQAVQHARKQNVLTVLAGFDKAVERFGNHGCDLARDLNGPADLPKLVGEVVSQVLARQRH